MSTDEDCEDRERCAELAVSWVIEGFERQQRALRHEQMVAICSSPESWDRQVDGAVEDLRVRIGYGTTAVVPNPTLNGIAEVVRRIATDLHNGDYAR